VIYDKRRRSGAAVQWASGAPGCEVGLSTYFIRPIRYAGRMENSFEEVFKSVIEHADAHTVYGEAVSVGGKTILPVALIRYGFGGGSGGKANDGQQGGGGGGGLISKPLGIVEITQSKTRFIPITSNWTMLAAVALGVCLGWLAVPKVD
jgi:uncharacterized spore protein YtfJ